MTDETVRDEILRATYTALCEHGYTDLTAQDIADRTDKSKSALFYHYDSKEALIADFITWLLERFDERVEQTRNRPPVERLATFLDWFIYDPADDERTSFHTAMLELRAQSPYNETYRTQLATGDRRLREALEEILRAGLETGEFHDHDPEAMASLLIAAVDGARVRQLTTGRDSYLEQVRAGLSDVIASELLDDDLEFPAAQLSARRGGAKADERDAVGEDGK